MQQDDSRPFPYSSSVPSIYFSSLPYTSSFLFSHYLIVSLLLPFLQSFHLHFFSSKSTSTSPACLPTSFLLFLPLLLNPFLLRLLYLILPVLVFLIFYLLIPLSDLPLTNPHPCHHHPLYHINTAFNFNRNTRFTI